MNDPVSNSTPLRLHLPRQIYDAIVAHARNGKPEEVCGLLRGRAGQVTDIRPTRNVAPNRITDYEVEPNALLAQFEWEEAGDELVAIYHSHPQDPAYPSASDAINAYYPDSVYLICSLQDDSQPDLQGYFLREARGRLGPAQLRGALPFYKTRPGRWGYYLPAGAVAPEVLNSLDGAPGLALYIVIQEQADDAPYVRAVTVSPVEVLIS